ANASAEADGLSSGTSFEDSFADLVETLILQGLDVKGELGNWQDEDICAQVGGFRRLFKALRDAQPDMLDCYPTLLLAALGAASHQMLVDEERVARFGWLGSEKDGVVRGTRVLADAFCNDCFEVQKPKTMDVLYVVLFFASLQKGSLRELSADADSVAAMVAKITKLVVKGEASEAEVARMMLTADMGEALRNMEQQYPPLSSDATVALEKREEYQKYLKKREVDILNAQSRRERRWAQSDNLPSDWECKKCGFSNFKSRTTCFQCENRRLKNKKPKPMKKREMAAKAEAEFEDTYGKFEDTF
ncbi:hypothetical protein CYMTET_24490, partial [Cymbomonas tetramitiformis]